MENQDLAIQTKNQIQTIATKSKKNLIIILVILGAVIIFTAPLVHIYFPKKPDNVKNFEKGIKEYEESIALDLSELKTRYSKGELSATKYISDRELIEQSFKIQSKKLDIELDAIVDSNRVFGFNTLRTFLIGIGIRLPLILYSFIVLFLVLYSKEKLKTNPYLYKAVTLLYTLSFLISFYLVAWFMIPKSKGKGDFTNEFYYYLIGTISILATFISIFMVKYFDNIISRLKKNISQLITLISDIRINHYFHMAAKAQTKENEAIIKKDVEIVEEKIFSTLEKVADES